MSLPNVLIIGSMKSGTTGIYMDLATHPDVFLAQDKEPQCLCSDQVMTDAGREEYAKLYHRAREDQVICDASTSYSKRPDYDGVPQRAVEVLPENFKVIYIVRHPIERIKSQHYHEYSAGLVSDNLYREVKQHSRYIDYSRYAYQLEPWLEAVGPERIMVVRFEDYVQQRVETVGKVCEFLGLSPNQCQIEADTIYNKSQDKPVLNSFWKQVSSNTIYRTVLRPLLPPKRRLEIYKRILPKAPEKPIDDSTEISDWLRASLFDDVLQFYELLGLQTPLWEDMKAVDTPAPIPFPVAATSSSLESV